MRSRARRRRATAAVRGRLFRALYADAWARRAGATGRLLPAAVPDPAAELYIQTSLLSRFPTGKLRPADLAGPRVPIERALSACRGRRVSDDRTSRVISRSARDPHPDRRRLVAVPQRAAERYAMRARASTMPRRRSSTACAGTSSIDNVVVRTVTCAAHMIRSMTGFGAADGVVGGGRVSVELRSVNHRFFSPRIKLPSELARWEARCARRCASGSRAGT